MQNIKIAPSILSANFSKMGEEIKQLETCGADIIHCDVMDGVFVPNITFGIKMVADIRKITKLPLDCHLMIVSPEKYVEAFAKAGADYITVHYEATGDNLEEVLKLIKSYNVKCGVVINPDTDAKVVKNVVKICDMILVMSVFPGFGGQKFIPTSIESLKTIKGYIDELNPDCRLEIDGGITEENVALVKNVGADTIVAGSTIFKAVDKAKVIDNLRNN